MMYKKAVFLGNERLATGVTTKAPILQALLQNGYQIQSVIANNEAGRSRKSRQLEIADFAKENNIPVLFPENPEEIKDQLQSLDADFGILAAYGKVVPQEIISLFPRGIINVHPSLLPIHRGPTPLESVILDGDTKTGVSIMKLAKDLDAGPVYGQSELKLNGKESKQELADKLLDISAAMLVELLPDILEGSIVALPQDESSAKYDQRIDKADGLIDWAKPAQRIEREIRAYLNWPGSRTMIAEKDVIITKASVLALDGTSGTIIVRDKKIVVFCAKHALEIERLKPAGKAEMSAEAFLAGYGRNL